MRNPTAPAHQQTFDELLQHMRQARQAVFVQVNTALIDLYWSVGRAISEQVQRAAWAKGVVSELADYIARNALEIKDFSDKNLWRMKQFYETCQGDEKLATRLRELPWTHNVILFARCKSNEERAFYGQLSIAERYSSRELERRINSAQFERMMLNQQKLSAVLRELHPAAGQVLKDSYVLEFLGLPEAHREAGLPQALVRQMKDFVLELGKDFIFMGEEFRLQVGNQDFFIDLLFYHRGLAALVAFELKIGSFAPEHLGQLNFYLEALDRDVKKPHENPSIGVLLCRDHDQEVVEYALSRNLSPALIAPIPTAIARQEAVATTPARVAAPRAARQRRSARQRRNPAAQRGGVVAVRHGSTRTARAAASQPTPQFLP